MQQHLILQRQDKIISGAKILQIVKPRKVFFEVYYCISCLSEQGEFETQKKLKRFSVEGSTLSLLLRLICFDFWSFQRAVQLPEEKSM